MLSIHANQTMKYEMAALSMHAITVQDQGNAHYTDQDQTLLLSAE